MTVLGVMLGLLLSLPLPLLFVLLTVAVFLIWTYNNSVNSEEASPPLLHYKKSALADCLLKKCSSLSKPFVPNVFVTSPHMQTIVSRILPGPEVNFERDYYQLKDKGVVALDWSIQSNKLIKFNKKSPIVIIIPGFIGSLDNFRNICAGAMKEGYRSVVFNRRGFAGCPLTTPKLQSFGDPSDLRQVIKYIHGKYPSASLLSVAYSTGSGLLLSYLGEYGSSTYLTAGVCISPGYDYQALYTRNGLSKHPYTWLLLTSLKMLINKHANALSKTIDVNAALKSSSLAEFEEAVFCKMYGFENIEQYWDKNNPMRDVDEVSIPVLAINSMDDPVCPPVTIPVELFKIYPNFMLAATEYGGHDGFLDGVRCDNWANRTALEYLRTVIEFMANGESNS